MKILKKMFFLTLLLNLTVANAADFAFSCNSNTGLNISGNIINERGALVNFKLPQEFPDEIYRPGVLTESDFGNYGLPEAGDVMIYRQGQLIAFHLKSRNSPIEDLTLAIEDHGDDNYNSAQARLRMKKNGQYMEIAMECAASTFY